MSPAVLPHGPTTTWLIRMVGSLVETRWLSV
jgi:hypothetical protein